MIVITVYSATAAGSAWRQVRCESCDADFIYRVSTQSKAGGFSSGKARSDAERQLIWRLVRYPEPIPCPNCGRYQSDMCKELRTRRFRRLEVVGMLLISLGLFPIPVGIAKMFDPDPPFLHENRYVLIALGVTLLIAGAFILRLKNSLWSRYDPNAEDTAEARRKEGRGRAMIADEFLRNYPSAEVIEA
jgi:hypothetical protein